MGDWGLGIGDWGLGIGPNPQSPIPNPQSPIPNPHEKDKCYFIIIIIILIKIKIIINNKLKNKYFIYQCTNISLDNYQLQQLVHHFQEY